MQCKVWKLGRNIPHTAAFCRAIFYPDAIPAAGLISSRTLVQLVGFFFLKRTSKLTSCWLRIPNSHSQSNQQCTLPYTLWPCTQVSMAANVPLHTHIHQKGEDHSWGFSGVENSVRNSAAGEFSSDTFNLTYLCIFSLPVGSVGSWTSHLSGTKEEQRRCWPPVMRKWYLTKGVSSPAQFVDYWYHHV